jgi:hypothetical protein
MLENRENRQLRKRIQNRINFKILSSGPANEFRICWFADFVQYFKLLAFWIIPRIKVYKY